MSRSVQGSGVLNLSLANEPEGCLSCDSSPAAPRLGPLEGVIDDLAGFRARSVALLLAERAEFDIALELTAPDLSALRRFCLSATAALVSGPGALDILAVVFDLLGVLKVLSFGREGVLIREGV